MTIIEWLVPSMKKISEAGVDSPRRDCLVLLEDLLNKDRSWVNTHADFALSEAQIRKLDGQIKRRENREPLAYIRGKAWFYGRFFEVSPKVLVPRPETESFIGLIKEIKPKKIIDIGTGSGCLAITAKLELPKSNVVATDLDEKVLQIAQKNSREHKAQIDFIHGSLLTPFEGKDLSGHTLLANLPYVPEGLITSGEINYEPKVALFSGKDGLDLYKKFWLQVKDFLNKPQYILVESMEDQQNAMTDLAKKAGYKLEKTEILVQQFRLA